MPGRRIRIKRSVLLGLVIGAVLLAGAYPGRGEARPLQATAPTLGTAASFAVLAGSTVTNTGPTTVHGNLGVWPGSAVTGFPPGQVSGGAIHKGDAVAQQAQSDVTTAYNALAGQPCTSNLTGQDLGGLTLTTGVYCYPSTSAQLTGTLTLNAQGNPNAVFIFQIGTTLTTASNSSVSLINGGNPCNVFWQIGSSATLGTGTSFVGNILALASITLTTGVSVIGRALARNAAVTMDTNTVSFAGCALSPTATSTTAPTPTATAPGTIIIVGGTPTAPPATATAIAAATSTAIAAPTSTAIAAATGTAIAGPTSTAIAAATATGIVAATGTAIAAPTGTALAAATNTAVVASTATAITAATGTAIAAPTSTALAIATATAVAAATATAITAATSTAVAVPTSTAIAASTAVAHATATAVTAATATAVSATTATAVARVPQTATVAVPTMVPNTGAGGTYMYTSANATRLARVVPAGSMVRAGVTSPVALPRTGGGGAGAGNDPSSPLAPLVLLCMGAIGVGRFMRRRIKRL